MRTDAVATPRVPGWLNALRLAVLGLGIPILIYWAAREQALDWQRGIGGWLVAGLALAQLAFMLYALRFRTVMALCGIALGYLDALRVAYLSVFYQFFVPLSVGGDVAKFVSLRLRAHGSVPVAAGIVLDHFVGLAALLVLSATLFAWRRPVDLRSELWLAAALLLLLMVGAGLAVLRHQRRERGGLRALPGLLARHRVRAAAALALSLAMQCLFAVAVWTGSRQWGIDIALADLLFVQATALMFQAVPLNLAGVGGAEVAGAALYVALGLPLPAAVLLVSLLYCCRLTIAVTGALWDLLAPGA